MARTTLIVTAAPDDAPLGVAELCRIGRVSAQWVHERVAEGLLVAVESRAGPDWRFDAVALHRVQCMVRLERDFDAVPELAALVADLQGEIERLRRRLAAAGLD